jgi:hypothetical protein
MCLPSLSQIQERIDKIFDGQDSMELEKWQIEGVKWEDEHIKQIQELKSKGKKSKNKKNKLVQEKERKVAEEERKKIENKIVIDNNMKERSNLTFWKLDPNGNKL